MEDIRGCVPSKSFEAWSFHLNFKGLTVFRESRTLTSGLLCCVYVGPSLLARKAWHLPVRQLHSFSVGARPLESVVAIRRAL